MVYKTLLKNDSLSVKTNEAGPQENYVNYKKPYLMDAPIDKQTRLNLEKLLKENHDASPADEREIGTTPLIKISIDTGDHPPTAKEPYVLALKCFDWVKEEIDNLLAEGVIRENHSSW